MSGTGTIVYRVKPEGLGVSDRPEVLITYWSSPDGMKASVKADLENGGGNVFAKRHFRGETAHMDAERLAFDILTAVRHDRAMPS